MHVDYKTLKNIFFIFAINENQSGTGVYCDFHNRHHVRGCSESALRPHVIMMD